MNKHITDYLDYYISLEAVPYYAVLLRGNWGSGKSWFIREYMKQEGEQKFLYVSLYGISNTRQIEEEFFQQLHPVLGSKAMRLAGKVLKGALKLGFRADIFGDDKQESTINVDTKDISFLGGVANRVLVFDDLERCSMPIKEILGYINSYVEYNDLKVIILANENEIDKVNESDKTIENNEYRQIKEKLIGKSFDIRTDFDEAMESFLSETGLTKISATLSDNKQLIKDIFNAAGYNNLRHLRQSILDFERFFKLLPKVAQEHEQLMSDIISVFFPISVELKKGAIKESEINNFFVTGISALFGEADDSPNSEIKQKYASIFPQVRAIGTEQLAEFFIHGITDESELEKVIMYSGYFGDQKTPAWIKIWHRHDLEDTLFRELLSEVVKEFKNKNIKDKYVFVHVTCILLCLVEEGLLKEKRKTILSIAKENIVELKKKGLLALNKYENFPGDSHAGFGYLGIEQTFIRDFLQDVKREAEKARNQSYPEKAVELLELLRKSVRDFGSQLNSFDKGEYHNIPILQFIDPKEFMDIVIGLSNLDKRTLASVFKTRYQYLEYNPSLKPELKFLQKVLSLLEKQAKKVKGEISGTIIGHLLVPSLQGCIKNLQSLKEVENDDFYNE
ncbi:P-loop NTPase fold protein [uncultured Pedobacter sp.]|uniref:P-loop NTPase fold protein n=1 Tax=uncultured Pedobacter sp. TaxID=246139 RepID=UPI0026210F55|nr:P-loop NTPase fold protein [uncultured Pedobacter sp.]